MQTNKFIGCVVCVLLVIGGTDSFAQSFASSSSSWGYSGYVNDYYYGDRSAFEMDDNMFTYGNSAMQNMGSTSWDSYSPGAISTAASSILAGSTIADYDETVYAPNRGRSIAPPRNAPIGDGLWILLLLAIGYGGYVYVRTLRCKKLDRFAERHNS